MTLIQKIQINKKKVNIILNLKEKINELKVSVLICTFNRGNLIHETLKSLIINQTIKPDEIIVVNGGGSNDCKEILQKWAKLFKRIKTIKTKNINLANSRNIGLQECEGDLILLTDDDARPFPDWIENIKKYHIKFPNAGLIGGDVLNNDEGKFLSKIADAITFPHHSSIKRVRSLPGVNSSYKKNVIKTVGEYDISLNRGEDVDFNWRVLESGWDIIYVPSIKVKHIHRDSWFELAYQHYMYGRSYYMLRDKWRNMYSIYPHDLKNLRSFIKYIFSWTFTPMFDAYLKSKNLKNHNFLVVIIIFFINLINRIGISVQKNLNDSKK